jgi:hypothetical protein
VQLRAFAIAFLASAHAWAIEGGGLDRTTTNAVAIATGGPQSPSVRCSGTLVSPNVVLTVRHCLAALASTVPKCDDTFPDPVAAPTDFWVSAGPDVEPSLGWKNVASWALPTPRQACGNDVALLVLATPFAPNEATPAHPVMSEASFRDAVQTRLIGIAGFGSTSAAGNDPGTRHSRFDIPIRCVPGDPSFACNGDLEFIDVREITSGSGPCTGDSGAGALLSTDHTTVFGVLSRGNVASGECGLGVFERTDVWRWLIAKTVVEATPAGATAPDWARAALPDAARIGDLCRTGTCSADADCVSFDGQRSFVCAAHCGAGCPDGTHCESNVCAPGPEPSPSSSGCAMSSHAPDGVVALAFLVVLARRRRLRADLRDRARAV